MKRTAVSSLDTKGHPAIVALDTISRPRLRGPGAIARGEHRPAGGQQGEEHDGEYSRHRDSSVHVILLWNSYSTFQQNTTDARHNPTKPTS